MTWPLRAPPDRAATMAQFYDLFNREANQRRITRLLDQLEASPTHGVLEIAAGTGVMAQVVAHRFADLPVIAVEPSPSMRVAFFTTMAADPVMRAQVRLVPTRAERLELDGVADLAMCFSALHVFSPRRREQVWRRLARALLPGGVLLVDQPSAPEAEPVAFKETLLLQTSVAGGKIILTYATEPTRCDRQRWLFRYRHLDASGRVLQELSNRTVSWRVGQTQLCAELAAAGLEAERTVDEPGTAGVLVVRRGGNRAVTT